MASVKIYVHIEDLENVESCIKNVSKPVRYTNILITNPHDYIEMDLSLQEFKWLEHFSKKEQTIERV